MARKLVPLLVIVCFVGFAFAVAGCGGDGDSSADTTVTVTTETTETTETETTDTETTETTETETTSDSDFTSAENCEEFAQIGARISEAVTGTSDLDAVQEAFDEYAAAAPEEIKGDFETLADYIGEIAAALGNLSPGETPSAEDLTKLQSLDATAATQAATNISTWVTENCTGTP